jgi:hypothetical protein
MAGLSLPLAIVVVARTSCLWGQRASCLLNLQQRACRLRPLKHRTRCPVAPPARCLRYNSRVIFGKGKGKTDLPRSARTVRDGQEDCGQHARSLRMPLLSCRAKPRHLKLFQDKVRDSSVRAGLAFSLGMTKTLPSARVVLASAGRTLHPFPRGTRELDFSFQPDTGSANFRCCEFTFRSHRLAGRIFHQGFAAH